MSITLLGISVDAVDAARLANFWAQALQRTVDDGATEDFASITADSEGPSEQLFGLIEVNSDVQPGDSGEALVDRSVGILFLRHEPFPFAAPRRWPGPCLS